MICFFHSVLVIILLLIKAACSTNVSQPFGTDQTLLFISGWPQSGTSLVNQVLSLSPHLSTMVQKCNEIHGKPCRNWNHEGQWLIGDLRPLLYPIMNSGAMCPANVANVRNSSLVSKSLWMQWSKYWDLSKPILVEKSPQSMLKIPLMRELFGGTHKLRFIIVIKHPITINLATPRNYEWLTHIDKNGNIKNQISDSQSNSPAEISANIDHFIKMMLDDNSNSTPCNMGWLLAMKTLHRQLTDLVNNAKESGISEVDIKIMRFEMFKSPLSLCQKMFKFIFNTSTNGGADIFIQDSYKNICNRYFTPTAIANAERKFNQDLMNLQKHQTSRPDGYRVPARGKHNSERASREHGRRGLLFTEKSDDPLFLNNYSYIMEKLDHRGLRFKEGITHDREQAFDFRPDLLSRSLVKRIEDFQAAIASASIKQRRALGQIHEELLEFGYGLFPGTYNNFEKSINKLSVWEL